MGRDFLVLEMSIEQSKFQSEFKRTTILHSKKAFEKIYFQIKIFFYLKKKRKKRKEKKIGLT